MPLTPEQRCALRIGKRLMHGYDALAEKSKIVFEPPAKHVPEPKLPTRFCCHNIPRHQPCDACGRDAALAAQYARDDAKRLTELLATLAMLPTKEVK